MTAKDTAALRARILVQDNGSVEEQKSNLVEDILGAFQNPKAWPMTDADRIKLLRYFYSKAQTIKATEEAVKDL